MGKNTKRPSLLHILANKHNTRAQDEKDLRMVIQCNMSHKTYKHLWRDLQTTAQHQDSISSYGWGDSEKKKEVESNTNSPSTGVCSSCLVFLQSKGHQKDWKNTKSSNDDGFQLERSTLWIKAGKDLHNSRPGAAECLISDFNLISAWSKKNQVSFNVLKLNNPPNNVTWPSTQLSPSLW